VKTDEIEAEGAVGAPPRDAPIDEKIAWLDACRKGLDARGLAVLDEVFPVFMRRHYGRVRRRALRWDVLEADVPDLVQDVFFALHGRVREHGVKRNLLTTLHIVARGKLLHEARTRRRTPTSVCFPSSGSAPPASSVDLARAIDLRTARSFIRDLSDAHRAVVEKIILEEKTSRVVALELGLAEGTVLSRLRAALHQLRARTAPWLPQSEGDAG
jgi:RNA polymerase sigma-70 factor (ECF subfamily)